MLESANGRKLVFFAPRQKSFDPQCLHLVRKTELEPLAVRSHLPRPCGLGSGCFGNPGRSGS